MRCFSTRIFVRNQSDGVGLSHRGEARQRTERADDSAGTATETHIALSAGEKEARYSSPPNLTFQPVTGEAKGRHDVKTE